MNKTELVLLLKEKLEVPQKQVEDTIGSLVDLVCETMATGEKVVITGLGTFEVRTRKARHGKNPRTGEDIIVPEQKTPAFKAGKQLKEAVKA
ncbi:MAG: HU family DNA-binding protein [Acholeplasmatales bacterium]|jgi:DNA-binding protein HU-beta|nr:HU family DNA-binding protein [Acholeplasmatales bacterium]